MIVEEGIPAAADDIRHRFGIADFEIAVILGSGLGPMARRVEGAQSFDYREFSCFPSSSVPGHAGRIVAGALLGRRVLLFEGRHHLYEGYSARQVSAPVRLAGELGCSRLLLTNASGGINKGFRAGDLMYLSDHINLLGDNPLRGETRDPFVDLSNLYDQAPFPSIENFALENGIRLHRGVLAALPGPSYETPAEIRALWMMGADVVSMSTVPEAIMGKYLRMKVAGISLISNPAAGLSARPLNHEEVLDAGERAMEDFTRLVLHLLAVWQDEGS